MDKLTCMQTFVSVVDAGGFSSAALKTGLSKALVSRYVGQLERTLGLRLLHRTTRRVRTTTVGQAYYERCRLLLEELAELESAVQSEQATPSGTLRINAPTSFAELRLMPVIAAYSERYPEVRIEMEMTDRFVNLVEEGVDLAIRIADLPDSSFVARKLGVVAMLACASPGYLDRYGEPKVPKDLVEHKCVIDTNYSSVDRWLIGNEASGEWVQVSGPIRVDSPKAARELLRSGQGIGLLPSFVVEEDIAGGRLCRLFPGIEPQTHGIHAVYTHRKHLSAKVRSFIEMVQAHLTNGESLAPQGNPAPDE